MNETLADELTRNREEFVLTPFPDGVTARRRYRFRRRHTPHFYIVTAALSMALLLCAVDIVVWQESSLVAVHVAFGILAVTCLTVMAAYFWGFYMAMSGNIPTDRLKIFIPHAVVGSLSPLIYVLNLTVAFDSVDQPRLNGLSLVLAFVSVGILIIQYSMGRRVVRVERLQLLTRVARS